jgi:hypothetical protein
MSTIKVTTIQNLSGVEVYTAKAWVNFNGTGTVAIRASGNVSSITDNGTGDYTVNFTVAMVDANYSVAFGGSRNGSSTDNFGMQFYSQTASTVRVNTFAPTVSFIDATSATVSVFR